MSFVSAILYSFLACNDLALQVANRFPQTGRQCHNWIEQAQFKCNILGHRLEKCRSRHSPNEQDRNASCISDLLAPEPSNQFTELLTYILPTFRPTSLLPRRRSSPRHSHRMWPPLRPTSTHGVELGLIWGARVFCHSRIDVLSLRWYATRSTPGETMEGAASNNLTSPDDKELSNEGGERRGVVVSRKEGWEKHKKKLPVRELNPGHPRDRQVYWPLY